MNRYEISFANQDLPPMKVLLIHNYLRPPSGENTVFEQEKALLESKGCEVVTYTRRNDEIPRWSMAKRLKLPLSLIWSHRSYGEIKRIVEEFRPDIAHFHNIFPLISPAAYYSCHRVGVPVVQTLHHFRLVCPGAFLFRDGKVCENCASLRFLPGILNGCYRNSRVQTAGLAFMIYVHHFMKTWQNQVDVYVVLSAFAMKKFQELRFPSTRFSIKPNFIGNTTRPSFQDRGYGVFIGRLGEEKGLEGLLEALRDCPEIHLKILGDGPRRQSILDKIKNYHLNNVQFVGLLSHEGCMDYLTNAQFLVFPSIWYEGMPMVVLEAMATGKPVIASRIGVLPEMVQDKVSGLLFEPGSVRDLVDKLKCVTRQPMEAREMGKRARRVFEARYTAAKNYEMLIGIYQSAIQSYNRRSSCLKPA
jgi:glycosyltransferase involved in cell wall biosynthesis